MCLGHGGLRQRIMGAPIALREKGPMTKPCPTHETALASAGATAAVPAAQTEAQ
jgi:hypothetical protein